MGAPLAPVNHVLCLSDWAKVAICGQQGEDLLEKRLIEVGEGGAVGGWGTLVEVKRAAERT